jgi:heme-degrading monooxygenase HmoA
MILEIARIEVKEGLGEEFEAAFAKAAPIFQRAKGCRGATLERSIENPSRYCLLVRWETLENHTVDFRESGNFSEWRKLVGHYFNSIPHVEHTTGAVSLDI